MATATRRRRYDPASLIAAGKWNPAQQAKIRKVMEEFKSGDLRSSNGARVTSKRQALAIALSQAKALTAASFTSKEREKLADKGEAMPGGSFPIRNTSDLRNAIQALGRAKNPEAAKRWIIKRAKELDAVGSLPESWGVTAAGFDETKHPRHEKGSKGGGQFKPKVGDVVETPHGREEVVSADDSRGIAFTRPVGAEEVPTSIGYEHLSPAPSEESDETTPDNESAEPHTPTNDERDSFDAGYQDTLDGAEAEAWGPDEILSDWDEIHMDPNRYGESDPAYIDGQKDALRELASQHDLELPTEEEIRAGYVSMYSADRMPPPSEGESHIQTSADGKTMRWNGSSWEEVETAGALTAAAAGLAPITPPKEWFDKPTLEGPTPITVTADGRVFGHAALWGTCHTGMGSVCRTPPRSQSDYRFFHLGEVETDKGPVSVGRVTMNTGHAPLTASRDMTIRHYDDTGTGAAHVRAYEDEHGIVLAGALVPDLPAEQAVKFKGAPVSGDWRSIGGKLELVGMLAVNVPGFPVPRAMAASLVMEDEEHTMALVAAGTYCSPSEIDRKLKALTARAQGIDGLVSAAMGGDVQTRRMRGMAAAARVADSDPAPPVEG